MAPQKIRILPWAKICSQFTHIFLANLEDEIISKFKRKSLVMPWFIYDIFSIWNDSWDEFPVFIHLFDSHGEFDFNNWLQNHWNISRFLDISIFKGFRFSKHNILGTEVYVKETDMHEILLKICSSKTHFIGILNSQFFKFLTIRNNMADFHKAISFLFEVIWEMINYQADFLDRLRRCYWRINDSRPILMIPLELL